MNLSIYVEALRDQLVVAAGASGPESRDTVEKLAPGLESAMRLAFLEALSAAAEEITAELAPGVVEVRLHGSDPSFVVSLPADEAGELATPPGGASPAVIPSGDDERSTSRLNLRLPEGLKARIEAAARSEGLSLNAWLVRAAAATVDGVPSPTPPRGPTGGGQYTGWVR